jgi:adenylylsulfate kinase
VILWIVGLSGAGKSTLGGEIFRRWRAVEPRTVLLDGDAVRRSAGTDRSPADYSLAGRRRNAEMIVDLCEQHDRAGENVVCCVLALFPDVRRANRRRFGRYVEVHVTAPMEELERRDPKGLYALARAGRADNVVGIDIPWSPPDGADFEVDTAHGPPPDVVAEVILARILPRRAA